MSEKEVLDKTLMECTSGSSNKFYEVTLLKEEIENKIFFTLMARWGSRKGVHRNKNMWKTEGGQFQQKYRGLGFATAKRKMRELIRSKTQKGYKKVKIPIPKTKKKEKKEKTLEETSLERFRMLDF